MTPSFGKVLDDHRGLGPGFDFLRVGLAASIVLTHAFFLTKNNSFIRDTPLWFVEYALVPMFFALSGFLIAGSAQRLTLKNFLLNRGLRIVPALAVDILVCALLIGPIVTTLPLASYFTDASFFRYMLNIIGWIHYDLPGVFKANPSSTVNGALWTVPWEIFCYAIMSVLMMSAIIKSAVKVAAVIAGFFIAGLLVQYFGHFIPGSIRWMGRLLFTSRGSQLIVAFLIGILAYQLRHRIAYSKPILLACIVICAVAVFTLGPPSVASVPNRLLVIPALVYITVYLGLTQIPMPAFFRNGDYSYGIYLYHDPFLQVLISLAPAVFLVPYSGALALYALGLPIALLIAFISWHKIEKPILAQRKKFSFVAKARGIETGDGAALVDMLPATTARG